MKQILLLVAFLGLTFASLDLLEISISTADFWNAGQFLRRWFPPNWTIAGSMFFQGVLTLATAYLGTTFAIIAALPLSLMAARKTSSGWCPVPIVRSLISGFRSIPDIVIGLVALTVVGPGPTAAIIALSVHNCGVIAKLLSERIDESPPGPYEALQTLGVPKLHSIIFALLPDLSPAIASQYFYRFEVSIRSSLALGFIGSGGIGQQLLNHFRTFDYPSVLMDLIVIIFLVIVVDLFSANVQRRIGHEA
jgi:phosphonate transport system permease protein